MKAAIYDTVTGAIIKIVEAPASQMNYQVSAGQMWFELMADQEVHDDTHYIANDQLLVRNKLTPHVTINGLTATITGLPAGMTIDVEGFTVMADDEPLTVRFDAFGRYVLHGHGLTAWRNITMELNVDA